MVTQSEARREHGATFNFLAVPGDHARALSEAALRSNIEERVTRGALHPKHAVDSIVRRSLKAEHFWSLVFIKFVTLFEVNRNGIFSER